MNKKNIVRIVDGKIVGAGLYNIGTPTLPELSNKQKKKLQKNKEKPTFSTILNNNFEINSSKPDQLIIRNKSKLTDNDYEWQLTSHQKKKNVNKNKRIMKITSKMIADLKKRRDELPYGHSERIQIENKLAQITKK